MKINSISKLVISIAVTVLFIITSCSQKSLDTAGNYRRTSKTDMANGEEIIYAKNSPHYQVGYEIYKQGGKIMVRLKDFTEDGRHAGILKNKEAFEIEQTDEDVYQHKMESEYGEITLHTFVFFDGGITIKEYTQYSNGSYNHESSVSYEKS